MATTTTQGGCSQVVRHQIVTLTLAGSSPVSRPTGPGGSGIACPKVELNPNPLI
jgi:hypothetical protein